MHNTRPLARRKHLTVGIWKHLAVGISCGVRLITLENLSFRLLSVTPKNVALCRKSKWLAEVQNTTIYWIQATEFISWWTVTSRTLLRSLVIMPICTWCSEDYSIMTKIIPAYSLSDPNIAPMSQWISCGQTKAAAENEWINIMSGLINLRSRRDINIMTEIKYCKGRKLLKVDF